MTSNSNKEVRIGIAGMGSMGKQHAKNIIDGKIPGARLTAVCDRDLSALESYKNLKSYNSSDEMIRGGEIDAILIATPHYDHTTIGIDALANGIHTLVEKPISVHKADCESLIAAHKDPKIVFSAMFNQRTDPHYTKLKKLIGGGELGEIRRVTWVITDWFRSQTYYDAGGWRATWAGEGGGVLLNQCPHQLDLWQWLFGMPRRIRAYCHIGKHHHIEVEDDVTAYMEYDDGKTGVFITSTGESPGSNRLEVAADRGRLVIEGGKITWNRNEIRTSEFCKTTPERFARPETWDIDIPVNGYGEQHIGIMKNFTDSILHGAELIAPARDGIHSVELANAMLLSSFKNETIELPLCSSEYAAFLKKKIETSTFKKNEVKEIESDDFTKSFNK